MSRSIGLFKRFWWAFLATAVVGTAAGLLVASVTNYVMPKKYESEAVIAVRPLESEKDSLGDEVPLEKRRDTPGLLKMAVVEIKSRELLGRVAEDLELTHRWSVDQGTAVRILDGVVKTQNIRESDLISIRVRHSNKEDARHITAEVVREFAS